MIEQHQITNAGHHQRILDPGAVDGYFSSIPEQQFHASGVHVEMASSCIVLNVCVLSALRHLYSCDFCDTVLLIRFRTHSRRERAGACRGKAPPSCLRKTTLPLKSPTGAFVAPPAAGPCCSSLLIRIAERFQKDGRKRKNDSIFESCRLRVRIRGLEPPPSCPD